MFLDSYYSKSAGSWIAHQNELSEHVTKRAEIKRDRFYVAFLSSGFTCKAYDPLSMGFTALKLSLRELPRLMESNPSPWCKSL